jgi:hypothetical protein
MHQAFLVAHGYLLSDQRVWVEQEGVSQEDGKQPQEGRLHEESKCVFSLHRQFNAHSENHRLMCLKARVVRTCAEVVADLKPVEP